MATNPYVNKVIYGNQTVMDISDTTAETSDVASGEVFYDRSGARSVGTADYYSPSDTAETILDDADYFPFYDASASAKRKTLWSNIKDKLNSVFFRRSEANVLGAKNLLKVPSDVVSKSENNVTFTVNRDSGGQLSSVNVNAAAAASSTTTLQLSRFVIPAGNYILSQGVNSSSKVTLQIMNTSYQQLYIISGEDVECSFNADTEIIVRVRVGSGDTPSNVTVYPMLRLASDPDNTFAPYAMTNKELTDSKMSYADNGVLGAKNLLRTPYYEGTSVNRSEVICVENSDGSVTLNGTAIDNSSYRLLRYDRDQDILDSLNGTKVILSSGNANINVGIYNTAFEKTGKEVIIDVNTATIVNWNLYIQLTNGTTYDNVTVYPMLRLASDTDPTYQPYAMTNKELTDKANSLATVATSGSYNDLSNKPSLGTAAAKNVDTAPTSGSTNLVESGGVFDKLAHEIVRTGVTVSAGGTVRIPSADSESEYITTSSVVIPVCDDNNGKPVKYTSCTAYNGYANIVVAEAITNKSIGVVVINN